MTYNISVIFNLEPIEIVESTHDYEPLGKHGWGAVKGQKGPSTGTKWSDEARARRSLLYKGRISPRRGMKCSEEDKLKKSLSQKGKKKTLEHNKKVSEKAKLRYRINLPNGKWKWGHKKSPCIDSI